jgi:hypothetical protein
MKNKYPKDYGKDLASKVMLTIVQNWGGRILNRDKVIHDVLEYTGIDAFIEDNRLHSYSKESLEEAEALFNSLKRVYTGKYETEVIKVQFILEETRLKNKAKQPGIFSRMFSQFVNFIKSISER